MYAENTEKSFKYQTRIGFLKVMSNGVGFSVDSPACLENREYQNSLYCKWKGSYHLFCDILEKWVILVLHDQI